MLSPFEFLDDKDDDSSDLDFFFLCHLAMEGAEEKEHSSKRQRRRCKRQLHSSEQQEQRRHKWHQERISWQSHVEKLNASQDCFREFCCSCMQLVGNDS